MNKIKNLFFKGKQKKLKLVFIVEDNVVYAKTLELYLKEKFPHSEIKYFPVGELCTNQLHLNPDVIIMDYFLNGKYYDAVDGLEIIREIKSNKKDINIILISSQNKADVIVEVVKEIGKNNYVVKDEMAFKNIDFIIKSVFKFI